MSRIVNLNPKSLDRKDSNMSKTIISVVLSLIFLGYLAATQTVAQSDSELTTLQAELEECQEIVRAYDRLNCEKAVKAKITLYEYKKDAQVHEVGPITFYWKGSGSEGNDFEVTGGGQAILNVRMLVENTGSNDNVSLSCTGPAICSYDVWNGEKSFKYSGTDFTNGQIVLKPGDSREFNMLFGPNIGYGGTTFEYDSSKQYVFRVSEPWGSLELPLDLP